MPRKISVTKAIRIWLGFSNVTGKGALKKKSRILYRTTIFKKWNFYKANLEVVMKLQKMVVKID